MAVIKPFRIKSFKKPKPIVSLKNISLSFGKRKILDKLVSFGMRRRAKEWPDQIWSF